MNFKVVIQDWNSRPWWMSLIFYFCIYMTFIYMPFDLFLKPVAEDEEIWFGFTLTGWYAKATEPLHWLIYGFGAYGFWRMKKWMWPWAPLKGPLHMIMARRVDAGVWEGAPRLTSWSIFIFNWEINDLRSKAP